ncbi:hypothetical protein DXG03_006137 [Asterophora parasitica]|uniref:Uncharacterized protein n=1 Tax=Asterophora parasitica TaxID=117018 RepID=A0A9P7GCS0_9AGAR|nr:hypothetical protein DXG03_006137 [Asterophora parasitica]
MSSDDYFDGEDLDDAIFEELDAIEAAALVSPRPQAQALKPAPSRNPPPLTRDEDSFYDLTLDIDDSELERIDDFVQDAYSGKAKPVAAPLSRTKSATHQTTLFGDIIPQNATASSSRTQLQRTKSAPRNPFGRQAPKTKVWDQTQFAKTGLKSGKAKSKGKAKASCDDDELEEEVEFEQFPAPFVPARYVYYSQDESAISLTPLPGH